MSPSDRLAELRRQRALLRQHADWLDREIAAAEPAEPGAPLPTPVVAPAPAPPAALANAEAILSQYRADEGRLKTDVRKGCLLYAAVAFALLVLGVVALYFLLRTPPM